jgi:hypothetical protein
MITNNSNSGTEVQQSENTVVPTSRQNIANTLVGSSLCQGTEIKDTQTVGKEFIEWAEQYWYIDKLIQPENPDIFNMETCNYTYMRDIFIQKIDGIIKERFGLGNFL